MMVLDLLLQICDQGLLLFDLLRAQGEEQKALIADLEKKIQDHHGHHHRHMSIHVEKIEALEGQNSEHRQSISSHQGKINELQLLLGDKGSEVQRHLEESGRHSRKAKDLEKMLHKKAEDHHEELSLVVREKDGHIRTHQSRINELEGLIEELRAAHDHTSKQHSTTRSKATELEQHKADLEASHEKHQRQHRDNRQKIQELELMLVDLQSAHDKHATESTTHKRRSEMLSSELEGLLSNDDKSKMEKAHRAELALLEERLALAEEARDKHLSDKNSHRTKITELEILLDELRNGESGHHRSHANNKKRIEDLEKEIEGHHETHEQNRGKHRDLTMRLSEMNEELAAARSDHGAKHRTSLDRISELEMLLAKKMEKLEQLERTETVAIDLEQRVAMLMQQLVDERKETVKAKEVIEKVQQEADEALARADALRKKLENRIAELETENAELRKRGSLSKRKTNLSSTRGMSFNADMFPKRDFLVGQLLPESTHDFVKKVQIATQTVGDAFKANYKAVWRRGTRAEISAMLFWSMHSVLRWILSAKQLQSRFKLQFMSSKH